MFTTETGKAVLLVLDTGAYCSMIKQNALWNGAEVGASNPANALVGITGTSLPHWPTAVHLGDREEARPSYVKCQCCPHPSLSAAVSAGRVLITALGLKIDHGKARAEMGKVRLNLLPANKTFNGIGVAWAWLRWRENVITKCAGG